LRSVLADTPQWGCGIPHRRDLVPTLADQPAVPRRTQPHACAHRSIAVSAPPVCLCGCPQARLERAALGHFCPRPHRCRGVSRRNMKQWHVLQQPRRPWLGPGALDRHARRSARIVVPRHARVRGEQVPTAPTAHARSTPATRAAHMPHCAGGCRGRAARADAPTIVPVTTAPFFSSIVTVSFVSFMRKRTSFIFLHDLRRAGRVLRSAPRDGRAQGRCRRPHHTPARAREW